VISVSFNASQPDLVRDDFHRRQRAGICDADVVHPFGLLAVMRTQQDP
jgi:hypothetical protein